MIHQEKQGSLAVNHTRENMRFRANRIIHLELYIAGPTIGLGER